MRQASKAALIAEAIWPGDAASRWLGMQIEEVRAGYARLSMRVTENLGDVLVSECIENAKAGRRGIYDARVTNPKGETIALFRGESATVKGHWIE